MVGSFIVAVIAVTLRIIAWTLTPKYSWLTKIAPYMDYGVIGCAALFALFVLIALIRAISKPRNK